MKRITAILLTLALLLSSSLPVFAKKNQELQIIIPSYSVEIGNSSIYHFDSLYPFISYKDITYFPMTYDYCRALGMVTHWSQEDGLYIARADTNGILPIYEHADNSGELFATLPDYDIYVNGRKIDNSKLEYPVLNFRYVTYFPMTYDFSREFLWTLDFTPEKFTVNKVTENSGVSTRYLEENSVIFSHSTWETYWQEPDFIYTVYPTLSTRNKQKNYYRADLDTFEVTEIEEPDYSKSSTMFPDFTYEPASEITEKDGKYFIDNMEIPDLNFEFFKETTGHKDDGTEYTLSASKNVSEDITFYEFIMRAIYPVSAAESGTPLQYFEEYVTYIKVGDKLIRCFPNTAPESVEKCGDDLYFTARKFVKTIGRHYSDQAMLFYLAKDAKEPISLTNKYNISHAELLGTHDGKLYFKAYFGYPMSGHEIKPHLDGYYTLDGDKLEKIGNYADVHYEFLKDDGSLYGIDYYKKEFIKLN